MWENKFDFFFDAESLKNTFKNIWITHIVICNYTNQLIKNGHHTREDEFANLFIVG